MSEARKKERLLDFNLWLDLDLERAKKPGSGYEAEDFKKLKARVEQAQQRSTVLACTDCKHATLQTVGGAPSFVGNSGLRSAERFTLLRVHCGALGGVACELSTREWDKTVPATAFQELVLTCEAREEEK